MPLLHSRFPHHRLHAYRDALALHQGVEAIARRFPVGHADLKDQLRRAAAATVRNIVEAASRYHPRDKAARYITARGECAECEVSLEMAEAILPDDAAELTRLERLADDVAAMLTGLVRCQERRMAGP